MRLAISRSIIEAQGGRLQARPIFPGARSLRSLYLFYLLVMRNAPNPPLSLVSSAPEKIYADFKNVSSSVKYAGWSSYIAKWLPFSEIQARALGIKSAIFRRSSGDISSYFAENNQ